MKEAIYKRWDTINTDINLSLFDEIVTFVINCSYFQFQGNFYSQIEGTAMGNPFSPVIADYVTEIILDQVTSEIDFPVPVLKKYVDDLVLAVPKDKVDEVVAIFNKQNPHIQFTVEVEVGGRLPFLDMVLVRDEHQHIRTEWYRKPISSGRFLNYHSHHPLHHKVNVAANFVKRVLDFSTNISRRQAMTIIHKELARNDYPKQLIGRMINRYDEKQLSRQNDTSESQNQTQVKTYFSLTNVNNLTQNIQKILQKDYTHISLAVKHTKTIKKLYPMVKAITPKEQQSYVIYKISCKECEGVYVGLTTTHLSLRTANHKTYQNKVRKLREQGYIEEDGQMREIQGKSALVSHCITKKHEFDIENTTILDRTNSLKKLKFLEMCHIRNTPHTVNKKQDTENLNIVYAGLLHNIKILYTPSQNQ
ncbi:uncharacterized protein LOC120421614 [Culex pipiens pallens]|uniref:uncharacterized protein LOC120421614 n=1 Tax=Culex pipiens pallens TaxID=42434 RepID=UPI0022AB13B7|nr:uncharacterized protein LOC120421614 [Culex pipiens pallens]